jgi:hypothetical protein
MNIIIAGTVFLSFINDATGTVYLVANAVSIRGITWIVKRVTQDISFDASKIIDFTGWSLAGISIVKIISKALDSVGEVEGFFVRLADYVDRITFWN